MVRTNTNSDSTVVVVGVEHYCEAPIDRHSVIVRGAVSFEYIYIYILYVYITGCERQSNHNANVLIQEK